MISNSQTNFLPLVQDNEFLPPISRWTTFGGLFILFMLSLALPVAAVVKYKVTVIGQAVVRPAGELRIVQAAAEGQVMQIYVKENQTLQTGDPIATIDDSRLQTKKNQMQTNIQQARLQLVQTVAQINAIDSQIRAESDRTNRTIASAKAELKGRDRDHQDKNITSITELQEAEANIKMAQEELYAGQAQLESALANLYATEAALGAATSKQNRYESAAKQGALSRDQLEEVQLAVKQQQQAVQAQKATYKAQEKTNERLKQAVFGAMARRYRAQAAIKPSNADVAIATERIAQEKASGEVTKATLERERQTLIKDKIETEKQLERDSSELKQAEIDLKQTTITATADGIISKLNLRNPGQTLRAGEEVVQIVPSHAPLVIKAAVGSEEKGKVKVGQKVQMRVTACPYPDYGTLNGVVKAIAPDAVTSQKNDANSDTNSIPRATAVGAFYEVTIEPEKLALGRSIKKCQIQLGMDGRVDIISREETVLQFLLRKARLITDF
ncbi:HlyD family efflux transporter periplasmic adaptor subunit [uncultured Nostoc sp.]|uniref:HlyD family efflux transporter periplasmic adaptor subunit n=1 Tax=uncultured Nostoc sp. TaxID=340711 RepID=UPI0035CC893F